MWLDWLKLLFWEGFGTLGRIAFSRPVVAGYYLLTPSLNPILAHIIMVNRNLIRSLEDDNIALELDNMFPIEESEELLLNSLHDADRQFDVNQIVEGKVVEINDEFVVVDVGFKSEGTIHRNEWGEGEELPAIGSTVKVLIEEVEDQFGNVEEHRGMISLSKRKLKRSFNGSDDVVRSRRPDRDRNCHPQDQRWTPGRYGVNVFLPASQVDIRRPNDIGDFIAGWCSAKFLRSTNCAAISWSAGVP